MTGQQAEKLPRLLQETTCGNSNSHTIHHFFVQCSRPYLESVLPRPAAKAAAAALLSKLDSTERSDSSSDDEEGQDLCNCEFSLAYGAKTSRPCDLCMLGDTSSITLR